MEHVPTFTLIFTTLQHLCSTEISNTQSESWFSANIINDEVYSPKPLLEIFSTEAPFSPTNPIVVLLSSSTSFLNNEPISTSTTNPPKSISSNTSPSTTTTTEVSVIPLPSSTPPSQQVNFQPSQQTIEPQPSTPSQPTPTVAQPQTVEPQPFISSQPPPTATQPQTIEPQPQPQLQQQSQQQPQPQLIQIQSQSNPQLTDPQPTTSPQLQTIQYQSQSVQQSLQTIQSKPTTVQSQSQPFQTQPQTTQPQLQSQPIQNQPSSIQLIQTQLQHLPQLRPLSLSQMDQPNYFVIYQQAPQTIQNYPSGSSTVSQPSIIDSPTTPVPIVTQSASTPPSTLVTVNPTNNQGAERITTFFPIVVTSSSATATSTLVPAIIQPTSSVAQLTSVVSEIPNITLPLQNTCGNNSNVALSSTTTSIPPQKNMPSQQPNNLFPMFRIRMISPKGMITNVILNPMSTTARTTTTRQKSKKQNYNECAKTCGGTRNPICASPSRLRPINADTLKGFPSVCHMACHNSFRKNLYEKVVDGRCGRLRTRIQTIDAKNKLNRNELQKLQYGVMQIGPDSMFEIVQ